jgi:hypothetical protein
MPARMWSRQMCLRRMRLQALAGIQVASPFNGRVLFAQSLKRRGCSGHDVNRSLQAFTGTAKGGAKRGIGELRCGNSSWGWRHIAEGHKGDRCKIGAPSGKSWDTFAKWCIGQTLGSPSSATYQKSNATYPYQAPVQIWNNGTLQQTYQNRVSVRTSDWVIVTSYISLA